MRKTLVFILLACAAGAVTTARDVDCNDFLQKQLKDEPHGEDELVGQTRQRRRRMMHPRSEPEIFRALDGVCREIAAASSGKAVWFAAPCGRLVSQHRSALEDHIFANGVADLRRVFCNELTDLCRPGQLHDLGEL